MRMILTEGLEGEMDAQCASRMASERYFPSFTDASQGKLNPLTVSAASSTETQLLLTVN